MNAITTLAGAIELRAGATPPQLRSSRPALARTLVRGRPASVVPEVLASVFALCGGAHRLVARRAIAAAHGIDAPPSADEARALQLDTLREQLRRLWLDWPAALASRGATANEMAPLRDCPVLRRDAAADALPPTRAWLEAHALDMPAHEWLTGWREQPADWLEVWTRHAATLPARLLRGCRDVAVAIGTAPAALRVQAEAASLHELAGRLRADPDFVRAPTIAGRAQETGPWTRSSDPAIARYDNAWLRLGARLADAVCLVLDDDRDAATGGYWLRSGALRLGRGEGLAWCEMARGLLVHRAQTVPESNGVVADTEVTEYDVLAPTEWNFHPDGAVAVALAQLPADADEKLVRLLAAAFDPCVEIRVLRAADGERRDA